jgi:hypothetical protein
MNKQNFFADNERYLFEELYNFIENLHSAGYSISTTQFTAAQNLLITLAAQGKLPPKLAQMRALLMPILCHSPQEQEAFKIHFNEWVNRVEGVKSDKTLLTKVVENISQEVKYTINRVKGFLLVIILLGIFLYVGKYISSSTPQSDTSSQPIEFVPTVTSKPIEPTAATLPKTTSPEPTFSSPETISEKSPEIQVQFYQQKWFWIILPLLLLILGWLSWNLGWQLFLKRKSTAQSLKTQKLIIKGIDKGIFQSVNFSRTAQKLRKHVPVATETLDLKATIKQTLQAGGWFTPVTEDIKSIPEYLVLIDKISFKDHHTHFINSLVNQLMAQGVFIARYYFDTDPRHCYPEKNDLPSLTLTELAARYPEHRLMVFSDGKGFINPVTGEIAHWIEQFSVWTQRIFFTLPKQEGYQTRLLEDANFIVMPADENGLAALGEWFNAEKAFFHPPKTIGDFSTFPVLLNDYPYWWLEYHTPEPAILTELLKQLQDFLGEAGYYWFSACAVYPELHWELTLYLGENLISTDGNKLLTEERLAKLASLPWFRHGYMPNWLRKQLIKELSLSQERKIREALEILLLTATTLEKPSSKSDLEIFSLEIAKTKFFKSTFARQLLSLLSNKYAKEDRKFRDYVFISFMKDNLAVKIPKMLYPIILGIPNKVYLIGASFYRQLITNMLRIPERVYQRIRWDFLPRLHRQLITNMMVGLSVFLWFSIFFHESPVFMEAKDSSMDWIMQIRQKIIPPAQERNIPPFVLLDIDDRTYQAWGEPLLTPRNRLTNLIKVAVQAKARLIIVNIDLSKESLIEGLPLPEKLRQHPYDQEIYDYLANYAERCKTQLACPPIILTRTFRPPFGPILVPRPSFLEPAVAQSTPYVQWASTLFYRSYDDVVRRWWLWQPTCMKQQPGIIPSAELLAAAIIRNGTPQQTQEILSTALSPFQPKNCTDKYILPQVLPKMIQMGQLTVRTEVRGIHQRIMYSMPWLIGNKPPRLPYFLADTNGEPILTVFPAQLFAESPPIASLTALQDKIIVIGGSYDGHDVYRTPLDYMPGSLILINAIHSLLQYEGIKPLSLWVKSLLITELILLMSITFAFFKYFWGIVLSGALIILIILPMILIMLPINITFLHSAIWLDFALPLIVVLLYQLAADFKEMEKQIKKYR